MSPGCWATRTESIGVAANANRYRDKAPSSGNNARNPPVTDTNDHDRLHFLAKFKQARDLHGRREPNVRIRGEGLWIRAVARRVSHSGHRVITLGPRRGEIDAWRDRPTCDPPVAP